jgi:uncharacterized FlaG/YvyC family protein
MTTIVHMLVNSKKSSVQDPKTIKLKGTGDFESMKVTAGTLGGTFDPAGRGSANLQVDQSEVDDLSTAINNKATVSIEIILECGAPQTPGGAQPITTHQFKQSPTGSALADKVVDIERMVKNIERLLATALPRDLGDEVRILHEGLDEVLRRLPPRRDSDIAPKASTG